MERGAGEEGRPLEAARGCSALVQKPEPGAAPRAACSSSSAGETAAPKPRAAASRGQGAGWKASLGFKPRRRQEGGNRAAPRSREGAAACWSSPGPRHFQASLMVPGNVNQRWFGSTDHLETVRSIYLIEGTRQLVFFALGKVKPCFLQ